ncbi:MAG: DNA alkylation repair protein [bacterium]
MDHQAIIKLLKREIARQDKPENQINYQQFFKETLAQPIGLKTPVLRSISKLCFKEVRGESAREILDLCDALLKAGERYFRVFAFEWACKVERDFLKSDFARFQRWLKDYVDGWGSCDHLCGGVIGPLLLQYPELVRRTAPWARSPNLWLRRGAAVALILPVRKGTMLKEVFQRADALLLDQEDLVQKGYGWMLKEAANLFPDEVFAYVMAHKDVMPRTALRYAIEKYPQAKRKQAMKKG